MGGVGGGDGRRTSACFLLADQLVLACHVVCVCVCASLCLLICLQRERVEHALRAACISTGLRVGSSRKQQQHWCSTGAAHSLAAGQQHSLASSQEAPNHSTTGVSSSCVLPINRSITNAFNQIAVQHRQTGETAS